MFFLASFEHLFRRERDSLTNQTLFHFLAAALGFFTGVPQPCIRAEMSRLVNQEEQGISRLLVQEGILIINVIIISQVQSCSLNCSI